MPRSLETKRQAGEWILTLDTEADFSHLIPRFTLDRENDTTTVFVREEEEIVALFECFSEKETEKAKKILGKKVNWIELVGVIFAMIDTPRYE